MVRLGQRERENRLVVGHKQRLVAIVAHRAQVVIGIAVFLGPARCQQAGINAGRAVFIGHIPLAKAAIDLVALGQHDGHVAEHQIAVLGVGLDDHHVQVLHIVHKAGNLAVMDLVGVEMLAAQLEHVLHRQLAPGHHALGDGKAAAQLVELLELAGAALIGPKLG